MFALRVTFLMGRAFSARFEDGDEKRAPEWPPHPGRLYCALVAGWGETGQDLQGRKALEWLECLARFPSVRFTDASERQPTRVYVPVNDVASIPDERSRQRRRFPSVSPIDPEVYYIWPDAEIPQALREPMERLAADTVSLGHPASLVHVQIAGAVPDGCSELVPDPSGSVRLRVPSPGRLKELSERYERFQRNPVKVNRPGPGKTAKYATPGKVLPAPRRSVFSEMVILRRTAGDLCPLAGTYQLTQALRGALMALAPDPPPECISGHAPGSVPDRPVRSEKPHLAIVPLPFVGSGHATGLIMGLAALLPETLTNAERDLFLEALYQVRKLNMGRGGAWEVRVTDEEVPEYNLRPSAWTRASRLWATVTPFVFDRYPKDPYGGEAQESVRRACEFAGLPRPASVALLPVSPHLGVPPSGAFSPAPTRNGKPQRFHQHAVLVFDEPIEGPVSIGAGRYYGYGFCRPLAEDA